MLSPISFKCRYLFFEAVKNRARTWTCVYVSSFHGPQSLLNGYKYTSTTLSDTKAFSSRTTEVSPLSETLKHIKHSQYRGKPLHKRQLDTASVEKAFYDASAMILDQPESDRFGLLSEHDRTLNAIDIRNDAGWQSSHEFKEKRYSRSSAIDEWSQTFGTLSDDVDKFLAKHMNCNDGFADDAGEEDESEKPYVRLSATERKHKPFYYGRRISKLGRAGKVYEAMQVLEKQMLKEDRVMPSQYVFTVLIGVLGRAGYTKKAFQLFNKMKKFGLAPEDPTYTALFNACSNSPWPADGIKRADDLRRLMSEKGHSPNMMTYNAMIKAYARCGDVQKAFAVVDEAIAAGHKPRGPCYCFILMACIAHKEAGMKLAIEVWRLMRRNRVRPSIHHYNLLLRAVRDCGLGNDEFALQLLPQGGSTNEELSKVLASDSVVEEPLNTLLSETNSIAELQPSFLMPDSKELKSSNTSEQHPTDRGYSIFDANVPDLLDPRNLPTGVAGLNVPQSAEGRLALLGGMPGILAQMQKHSAQPTIKTFSLMLELIPSCRTAENDLVSAMTLHNVQPDVDFFAMLIRKRNLRHDYIGAHEVLDLVHQTGLKPNIRTFGCLAMGCPTLNDARQLVKDMQAVDLAPNIEICEILLFQSHLDFSYKLEVLQMMKTFEIRPSEKFIEKLEKSIEFARKKIVQKERGLPVSEFYRSEYFAQGFQKFIMQYRSWLLSMNLEPKVHPWAKFRQPTPSLDQMHAPDEFINDDDRHMMGT